jgi:hypothetical protein
MNVLGDEGIPGVANVGDYATSERESQFARVVLTDQRALRRFWNN